MIFKPHELNPSCRLWAYREHLPEDGSMYWLYDSIGPELDDVKYNKGCWNVLKSRVHQVHALALGYCVGVDPGNCPVPFLEKPERQCMHQRFRVMNENCDPLPGMVYEKLLDNTSEIRYFYCRTGTDFYLVKTRPPNLFTDYRIVKLVIPNERFDFVEKFAKAFGIDFAELDILHDGEVPYVTDVNNVAGQGILMSKFSNRVIFEHLNKLYAEQVKTL